LNQRVGEKFLSILPILEIPHPILRKKAKRVRSITKKELKRQEKMLSIEFKQMPIAKIEVAKQKELLKEVLSSSPT